MGDITPAVRGVITVQHAGKPAKMFDGICLSLLVTLNTNNRQLLKGMDESKYEWYTLTDQELTRRLEEILEEEGMIVPLLLLR